MPALVRQMSIHNGRSDARAEDAMRRAEAACPTCFTWRAQYMRRLQPRWGGSYARMDAFARQAPVADNPMLALLAGYADLDRSEMAWQDAQADTALAAIERACAIGEHAPFLRERAAVLRRKGRPELSLRDLTRAIELRPGDPALRFERARAETDALHFQAAGIDLVDALRLDPTHSEAAVLRDEIVAGLSVATTRAFQERRFDDAMRLVDLASEIAPWEKKVMRLRVLVVTRGAPPSEELARDLRARADAAPDDFRAHQALDYVLAQLGRHAEVQAMWGRYIERNPDEGRAFLERSGSYHLVGKTEESRRDAIRACELGVSEGCFFANVP